MDTFFTQKNCDRCDKPLTGGRTMSMFNTDTICLECANAERKRADYEAYPPRRQPSREAGSMRGARVAERTAVAAGDRNFKGVGL